MSLPIGIAAKTKAEHLLIANWKPSAIADNIRCHPTTVYKWEQRLPLLVLIIRSLSLSLMLFY